LVHAVTLPQLATPDFRSCLVHAEPAPNLRHAATAQALSSSFGMPTHAAVRAADFSATVAARPNVRCGSFWTLSKRALTPLSAFTGIGANSIFNLKMQG